MSYQDAKSKNFSKYCADGNISLVKKWLSNPNVDINYNLNSPLRNAVRNNHIDVIRLLISHPKLNTDFDGPNRELKGAIATTIGKTIACVINPFTVAIANKNFEVLNIFINEANPPFKVKRKANLDLLLEMNDTDLNIYFLDQPDFMNYVLSHGDTYVNILPQDIKDVFVFLV